VTGGLVAALAVAAASVATSIWVSGRTNSGLFGICGPYGSGSWIAVTATLFLGAPLIGITIGFLIAKRLWRREIRQHVDS